jgi:tetratricopeptide (TPR) repeat protein
MTISTRLPLAAAVLTLTVIGCSTPPHGHQHGPRVTSSPPVLFDDLGTHHQAITTASPRAQQYFDQGLRLVYGFNHYEAQRAFQESARLDPGCAMCYWGIALTYGSNYNSPTDAERERGAWQAIQKARALAGGATGRERAVIEALAARHSDSPAADRAALDRAYADAMREVTILRRVASRVPEDRTVAGFFKTRDMLALATAVLGGEIAARAGGYADAVMQLTEAVRLQDEHWFTEPPPWYYPVRQSLGAVLLQAGRAPEAESVYREDLRRNPENGWALYGLAQALRAQGKAQEAAATDERFRRAWSRADVTLSASRF